jgi:tetratricopeptide (TPR) repeat protein
MTEHDAGPDFADRAAAVRTAADLAALLRELRRREARHRRAPLLTYHQIAARAGCSIGSLSGYFTGAMLPPTERFDILLHILGARRDEQGAFATARDRVADGAAPARVATASPSIAEAARMLPAAPRDFTGRAPAIAQLDALLAGRSAPATVVITALTGMGGVGKTTLAVYWAHSVSQEFPDGQLYVNLRGYDPGEPLSTMDALGVLLGGLGVPPSGIPDDEAGRRALYQTVLSGRRALVVLDNAATAAAVRPLLPPATCLTIVTSRHDLDELATLLGAGRIGLDVFAETEALALLRRLLGDQGRDEPEAMRALARQCGYLPLALRIVAELAVFRGANSLSSLVAELDAELVQTGLEAFGSTGDVRSDLRAVFSWSVRVLPVPAARAFSLLGLVPGVDVDEYELAALTGDTPAGACAALETLRRAHLVEPSPTGRWTMHDLVRAHVRELARLDLAAEEQRLATTRLLDYYLRAATLAVDVQFPFHKPPQARRQPTPVADPVLPALEQMAEASAWLRATRANLVAAGVHAARHGWPGHAVALSLVLWPLLGDGQEHDALALHSAALDAVQALGDEFDPAQRAGIRGCLAVTTFALGRLDEAAHHAEQAFAEHTRIGNTGGTALSLAVLGAVREGQGRFRDAVQCHERGLAVARSAGVRQSESSQLFNLGETYLRLEEYETAARHYRMAADIEEELGQRLALAESWHGVARAYAGLGRFAQALPLAEEALAVEIEHGRTVERVLVMDTLAVIYRGLGRLTEAVEQLGEAIEWCREITSPRPVAQVLNTLGEAYHECGEYTLARTSHEEALEAAVRASDRIQRTRALVGLGDASAGLGDGEVARTLWQEALTHYTDMGLPSASRVADRLRGGDRPS